MHSINCGSNLIDHLIGFLYVGEVSESLRSCRVSTLLGHEAVHIK